MVHSTDKKTGPSHEAPASPDSLMRALKDVGDPGQNTPKGSARAQRTYPPVDKWNPDFCGDLPMEIKRDGTWMYMGTPIGRKPMVRLFSSVLRRDNDGKYYLVTPVEKVGITVEDAPLHAVHLTVDGSGRTQRLTFGTLTDDQVTADADHPIRVSYDPGTNEPSPYVLVRANLEALINRNVFYDLVEHAVTETVDGTNMFGVWSAGTFFPFAPAEEVTG